MSKKFLYPKGLKVLDKKSRFFIDYLEEMYPT